MDLKLIRHLRLIMILTIQLIIWLQIGGLNSETKEINPCQSGLREDNTNYIYCARQALTKIPNFFANPVGQDSRPVVNVIYDELVLSDNCIHSIDQTSFANNLKVKKLYLDQNPLLHIDENAFDNVRNYLEEVYFEKKADSKTFKNSLYDYVLDDQARQSDDLNIFQEPVLKKCFKLRLLSVKNYKIAEIKENMFSRLNKLEKLELVNLGVRRVDELAFYGLEMSLLELNLDSNSLDSVPSHALGSLKRLKKLTLSQNRIKTLHSNAFFKVSSSLTMLDLSYNYLAEVDENAFNGPIQNSLKTVLIQNNELKWSHFVDLLFNLHQLQELNIDFNKLSVRTDQEYDDSSSENYSDILLAMTSLSMQGNALTESSLAAFGVLYDYQLSNSPYLRRKFKYDKLMKLNLARNKIKSIPDRFFSRLNMTRLKVLIMDRNPFATKQFNINTFSGLERSLDMLSLNSAGFPLWSNSLLEALNILDSLKILKLNGNEDSGSTSGKLLLKNLTSLEIQNSNLNDLPNFVCEMPNLVDLDISSNKIQRINSDCSLFKLGQNRSKLRHLNLNNNPLVCDCEMRELKIWLANNYDKDLLELIKWQCSKPVKLREKLLTNVPLRDLVCEKRAEESDYDSSILVLHSDELKPNILSSQPTTVVTTTHSVDQSSTLTYNYPIDDSKNILIWIFLAIGLSLLIVMTLILISLYLVCIRSRNVDQKQTYIREYLFDNKRFLSHTPLFSLSNSSASSTTTSVGSIYTKSSATDLVDIFGGEYFNGILGREKVSHTNTMCQSPHYYDKPINSICNRYKNGLVASSSLFFQQPSIVKDHIYHEINNDSSRNQLETLGFKKGAKSINNDNYLLQSDCSPRYNSLSFHSFNNNLQNVCKLNSFSEGLIV